MGEFELIRQFFTRPTPKAVLGVGDDCALLQPGPGMQMAISSDMLVSGRHFFPDVAPRTLGHKALAVNLSDLAACGARPLAFTLALALPSVDAEWLKEFSDGLWTLADAHGCELIGGDTTQGPLNLCITVFGEVPQGQALLRSGAHPGDDIYVSGSLGDARLALEHLLGNLTLPPEIFAASRQRLECPTPRVALGLALRGVASACADISDGLVGDLGHILERSGVGARLDEAALRGLMAGHSSSLSHLPVSAPWPITPEQQLQFVASGGDDYELVFTAAPNKREAVLGASRQCSTPVSRIGSISADAGLQVQDADGLPVPLPFSAFDHFKA